MDLDEMNRVDMDQLRARFKTSQEAREFHENTLREDNNAMLFWGVCVVVVSVIVFVVMEAADLRMP